MTHATRQTRRHMLVMAGALAAAAGHGALAAPIGQLVVYKTPSCGCCQGWVTHMRRAGFQASVRELADVSPIRQKYGVRGRESSCHTAIIGGYVIEGHVPAGDVARLLRERPKALGLSVPGMVVGSPGMEGPSGQTGPYATLLLLDRTGRTRLFARHSLKS